MKSSAIRKALDLIMSLRFKKLKSKILIKYGSPKIVFTEFYKNNIWGSEDSVSGVGTELKYTENIINEIPLLLKNLYIKSIADIPCGDFHYMKNIDLTGYEYSGFDIVKEMIEKNKIEFESIGITFRYFDAINEVLLKHDIIICRDLFIHFSFANTLKTIENFKKSGTKYLLTNTYPEISLNKDIKTGNWRPINLALEPYNFTKPEYIIEEHTSVEHGLKQLALYVIN